jgi:succinyl-diaminopimelate desuccinylase
MTIEKKALDLTRALIRFNTINPPGKERSCVEYLGGLLETAGFHLRYDEFAPERASVVARKGGSVDKPPLCFVGHVDTVPLGATPWTIDPFKAEMSGEKLYGRGSSDMKSGVAAFVVAATELADRLEGTAGLTFVIVGGEETGCEGSFHLAGLPEFLGKAGAILVAEPTSNRPLVGHKGSLWLRARTRGVTAHGSMPERGVNAIYKAVEAITKLRNFDFDFPSHAYLGNPTLNVGTISGGININNVPDEASIGIDIRTIPGQDHAALIDRMGKYLGEEVELSRVLDVNGLWTEPTGPWVQEVFETMTRILGRRPDVATVPYFTDAAALTPAYGGAPTVIQGPGEAAMAHQTDEYCYVECINQAVEAYMEIARKWCGL